MHRSFFGARLIPRIADAVREGRLSGNDDTTIDEAIDQAIKHHTGNTILSEKQHGRRDFADHAEQLIEHRDTLSGFYLPHGHDEAHNRRVQRADELFPYDTGHTRKNGYVAGAARSEHLSIAGVSAAFTSGFGVLGYALSTVFESVSMPPTRVGAGFAISAGVVASFSKAPMHIVNQRYRAVGEQADKVWDAYVEEQDYEAKVNKPRIPYRYVNASTYREPRTPSLTSSKP